MWAKADDAELAEVARRQAAWGAGDDGHVEPHPFAWLSDGTPAPTWVAGRHERPSPADALRLACVGSSPGRRGPASLRRAERATHDIERLESATDAIRDSRTPQAARAAISRWVSQAYDGDALDAWEVDHGLGWDRWAYDDAASSSQETQDSAHRATGPLVGTRTSERGVAALTAPSWARPRTPDYVVRCPRSQFTSRQPPLVLRTWLHDAPDAQRRGLVLCGSWRCDSCQHWRASVDYARIKEAFDAYASRDCVYLVLTLDRNGRYSGEAWADATQAFEQLSRQTRNFLSRLNRMCERNGWDAPGSRWVGTVEAHRSGWPHLNLVLVSRDLAEHLRSSAELRESACRDLGGSEVQARNERILLHGELLSHAMATGWGPMSSAEAARSKGALADYVVKLARKMDQTVGEVAKMTQRPTAAPPGVRRLRSGRGFLPPRRRSGRSGVVLHSRWGHGARFSGPVVRPYGRPSKLAQGQSWVWWRRRRDDIDTAIRQEAAFLTASTDAPPALVRWGEWTPKLRDERCVPSGSTGPPPTASAG